jgi:hypothetical protein
MLHLTKKLLILLIFLLPVQLFALTLEDLEGRWELEPTQQSMYQQLLSGLPKTEQEITKNALEKDQVNLQNLKKIEFLHSGTVVFDKTGNALWINSLVILVNVKELKIKVQGAAAAWSSTAKVSIKNDTLTEVQTNCTSQRIPYLDTLFATHVKDFDVEGMKALLFLNMPECEESRIIKGDEQGISINYQIVSHNPNKVIFESPGGKIVLNRRKI